MARAALPARGIWQDAQVTRRLPLIVSPVAPLAVVDDRQVVLLTVENWPDRVRLRLAVVQDRSTDDLDSEFELAAQADHGRHTVEMPGAIFLGQMGSLTASVRSTSSRTRPRAIERSSWTWVTAHSGALVDCGTQGSPRRRQRSRICPAVRKGGSRSGPIPPAVNLGQAELISPCSLHRADHPRGRTWTTMRRRHCAQ